MEINKERLRNKTKAFYSIFIGTVAGVLTYMFFLYYDIDILGWNLGLFFAPMVAGYLETYVAKKLIGEDIGAISAFILFIVTVIYGFIIDNPTLGFNLITAGSIIVIIQAAAPIAINYILIVVIAGMLSYFTGFFKKLTDAIDNAIRKLIGKPKKQAEKIRTFDDMKSNKMINSQDFFYITTTDIHEHLSYENLGYVYTTTILERNTRLINPYPEDVEKKHMYELKKGKDDCLIRLAEKIKSKGGNGVIDLEIKYFLNGLGGANFEIVASGMAVRIRVPDQAS